MDILPELNGWVIASEGGKNGRKVPRYFLVAATDPDQALALCRRRFGVELDLTVKTAAAPSHLERRRMKPGDACEIASQRPVRAGPSDAIER